MVSSHFEFKDKTGADLMVVAAGLINATSWQTFLLYPIKHKNKRDETIMRIRRIREHLPIYVSTYFGVLYIRSIT